MWSNADTTHPFMFPPMPFDLKPQNFENGHRSRGMGRMRGNYRSPGGYPRVNSEANAQFYCDTCNRAFADGQSLSEHLAQHKTCSWEGCTFEAHYKMVELHVKMQHETGLADKIMMLNTPEEIEKWKNERKRNYPTAVNVARRQAEQAKQAERGELIPNKEFGKFRRNRGRPFERNGSTRGRGRGRGMTDGVDRTHDQFVARGRGGQSRRKRRRPCSNNNNNNNNNKDNNDNNGLPTVSNDYFGWDEADGLKRFEGTVTAAPEAGQSRRLHEENPEGDLITDSEGETMTETEKASVQGPNANVPKALENLLTAYPSDSEEETSIRAPIAKVAKPREEHYPKTWNRPQFQVQKRSTLLEMLLSKEIQQERNQIFQCVRYIVQNEFFGIGREKVEGLEETFEEQPDECKKVTDNLCTKTPSDV